MTFLLDTNVISQLGRRKPDPGVLRWIAGVRPDELYLSVLTLGELRRGAELLRRHDERAATSLNSWIGETVHDYRDRLQPVTVEIAERWALLNVPRLPTVDSLLAATALVHDWTLVTRNTADVERTGVRTLNPFTPRQ